MKLYATLLAFTVASPLAAAPYYVGKNPTPSNSLYLNFEDVPTKKGGIRTDTGNIATIDLNGEATIAPNLTATGSLPFYMATKNATGTKSENNIGNLAFALNWNNPVSASTDDFRWGYMADAEVFIPTARNSVAAVVGSAHPTVNLWRYSPFTTTVRPQVGLFASQTYYSLKTNIAYAYNYISKESLAAGDKNRGAFEWQLGASWHPMEALNVNLEYNTIYLDKKTAGTSARYLHAIAPSVSGEFGQAVAALYASFPLDRPTRDLTAVAIGLNAGITY